MAAVLKTAVGQPTVGSNPTPSATFEIKELRTLKLSEATLVRTNFKVFVNDCGSLGEVNGGGLSRIACVTGDAPEAPKSWANYS